MPSLVSLPLLTKPVPECDTRSARSTHSRHIDAPCACAAAVRTGATTYARRQVAAILRRAARPTNLPAPVSPPTRAAPFGAVVAPSPCHTSRLSLALRRFAWDERTRRAPHPSPPPSAPALQLALPPLLRAAPLHGSRAPRRPLVSRRVCCFRAAPRPPPRVFFSDKSPTLRRSSAVARPGCSRATARSTRAPTLAARRHPLPRRLTRTTHRGRRFQQSLRFHLVCFRVARCLRRRALPPAAPAQCRPSQTSMSCAVARRAA